MTSAFLLTWMMCLTSGVAAASEVSDSDPGFVDYQKTVLGPIASDFKGISSLAYRTDLTFTINGATVEHRHLYRYFKDKIRVEAERLDAGKSTSKDLIIWDGAHQYWLDPADSSVRVSAGAMSYAEAYSPIASFYRIWGNIPTHPAITLASIQDGSFVALIRSQIIQVKESGDGSTFSFFPQNVNKATASGTGADAKPTVRYDFRKSTSSAWPASVSAFDAEGKPLAEWTYDLAPAPCTVQGQPPIHPIFPSRITGTYFEDGKLDYTATTTMETVRVDDPEDMQPELYTMDLSSASHVNVDKDDKPAAAGK